MVEFDRIAVYLHFNSDVGLTYDSKPRSLAAFADASWETRFSTSGWRYCEDDQGNGWLPGQTKPYCNCFCYLLIPHLICLGITPP